mgnify:FL=1
MKVAKKQEKVSLNRSVCCDIIVRERKKAVMFNDDYLFNETFYGFKRYK